MMKKIGFICVFLVALLMQVSAQENAISNAMNNKYEIKISEKETKENEENNYNLWRGWSVGLNYGITKFRGDISQYDHYPAYQEKVKFFELKTAFSFHIEKKINSFYAISTEFSSGKFAGLRRKNEYSAHVVYDLENNYEGIGDKFVASFSELDLLVNIDLINAMSYFRQYKVDRKIHFNGKLGIGHNIFNSLRKNLMSDTYIYSYGYLDGNDSIKLSDYGKMEKSFLNQAKETVYIYGVRVNYKANKKLSLNIDYTVRNGLADKWDASIMNTQYVTDKFTFLSLGMAYKIGREINESEWVSPIDGFRDDVTTLFVKIDGFTDDADNDGVSDAFDKSPNTPLGVAVDGSGNALDVDMDNVPDYRDADPFSNRAVLVDANGVELDDDNDGVPNSKDLESNTLVGTMVNQFGMNVSGSVYANGGGMIYFPSIYFNSGSAIVGSSNENRIATISLMLKNNADISLNVIGHTDNVGDTKFNKELGLKRAKAVINYLVSNYSIDSKRLVAITKGEQDPLSNVAEGISEVNVLTKINRRVDFKINK